MDLLQWLFWPYAGNESPLLCVVEIRTVILLCQELIGVNTGGKKGWGYRGNINGGIKRCDGI